MPPDPTAYFREVLREVLRDHLQEMGRVTDMVGRASSEDHDLLISINGKVETLLDKIRTLETTHAQKHEELDKRVRKLEELRWEAGGALKATHWGVGIISSLLGGLCVWVAGKLFGK